MSVFIVQLNNTQQGLLDLDPSTATGSTVGGAGINGALGTQMQPSIQRTMFCTGPNRIYRKLKDGETFTDCNYWKRFAFPNISLDQAFISVITDDGSIYSDDPSQNTFPFADTITVAAADTFADNYIDLVTLYGSYAVFTSIANLGSAGTQDISVQLNGSSSAVFTLAAGDTQIFSAGDLTITKLAFSGGTADTTVQVILSIQSVCNS